MKSKSEKNANIRTNYDKKKSQLKRVVIFTTYDYNNSLNTVRRQEKYNNPPFILMNSGGILGQ